MSQIIEQEESDKEQRLKRHMQIALKEARIERKRLTLEIDALEQALLKADKSRGSYSQEDLKRFNEAPRTYHHIDINTNKFRVSVQLNGKRLQKRFKLLDEAMEYRNKLMHTI